MIWLLGCLGTKAVEEESTCFVDSFPSTSFVLLPEQERIQIHADTVSDGTDTWVVYNMPNDENQFETHLLALDCTGAIIWGPEHIMSDPGVNQTTPRIAVSGERILVATHGDSGQGPHNLSIRIYIQSTEGEVLENRIWDDPVEGVSAGNRWLPSVVGTKEGFWIAAAVAREDHFQTAIQALDIDGQARGAAYWAGPDAYAVFPNIDAQGDSYVVAWETGEDSIQWVQGDIGGVLSDVQTIENSAAPRVLWEEGTPKVFAHQRSPTVVQLNGIDISDFSYSHTPNAVRGDTTTLFMHYRIQSGTANDLHYGVIRDDGAQLLDQVIAQEPPAAPYRPALTHIVDDAYLLLWSEGNNPDFQLRAQFLSLEP